MAQVIPVIVDYVLITQNLTSGLNILSYRLINPLRMHEDYKTVVSLCLLVCLSVCQCMCVSVCYQATSYNVCLNVQSNVCLNVQSILNRDMACFAILLNWKICDNLNSHHDASAYAQNVAGRTNAACIAVKAT